MLSDGTDPAAAAHQHAMVLKAFERDPTNFLFGAVPVYEVGAPQGELIWNQWMERWTILVLSPWIEIEQLNTAWALILMITSGLAMFWMCRLWGWHWAISWGLAFAWAFSAYMRARAKVHAGFVGTFHLPLMICAFLILAQGRSKRSVALAAVLLWLAAGASHYYLIMVGCAAPLFLWIYISLQNQPWRQGIAKLAVAALPAVLSVAYIFVNPAPADFLKGRDSVFPTTGQSEVWPHPYLEFFAARPLDYLTGDTGIGPLDLNPLKTWLNTANFEWSTVGNFHERTNGIRWSIWVLVILTLTGILWSIRRKNPLMAEQRQALAFFGLAVFGFCLSLPPSYLGPEWTPSVAVNSVISQFRVSSRAGLFVSFGFLVIAGLGLDRWLKSQGVLARKWIWIFPVLILIELPPFYQPMPAAAIAAPYSDLQNKTFDQCGLGFRFPYVSQGIGTMDYYLFLQQMRGSNCQAMNAGSGSRLDRFMIQQFGLHEGTVRQVQQSQAGLIDKLTQFSKCLNLGWLSFDPRLPLDWQQTACQRLQGSLSAQGICLRQMEGPRVPEPAQLDQCMRLIN